MDETTKSSSTTQSGTSAMGVIVVLAALVVIMAGLKLASSILAPILLAAFLATITYPAISALHRKGLPNWGAITLVCVTVIAAGAGIFFILYSSLSQFAADLPSYEAQMAEQTQSIVDWLSDHGINTSEELTLPAFTGQALAGVAADVIAGVIDALSSFFFLFMLTVFYMVDSSIMIKKTQFLLRNDSQRLKALAQFVSSLQQFFAIKSLENFLISGGMVILLLIFDVPYPLLWGILGFFLSFIPSVGLILACIPPVLLAYATNGMTAAAVIAIGVVIINQVGDNVILPMIAAKGLNMPLSTQFAAVLLWAWLFGATGALLAIPLTMVVRMLFSFSEQTAWIASMLTGPDEVETTDDVDQPAASVAGSSV